MTDTTAETSEPLIDLPVAELTEEAFAPYGQVLKPEEDGLPYGPQDAALDLGNGTPRFYLMQLHGKPLRFDRITRHLRVTQCLASVGGGEWLVAVAPPENLDDPDAVPDLTRLKAFRIPGDRAIKLHTGTWHAGPYFSEREMAFFNLELSDTNVTDHHTCKLDKTFGKQFRFVA